MAFSSGLSSATKNIFSIVLTTTGFLLTAKEF